MTYPSKTVRIGGQRFTIRGLDDADPYFNAIRDGFDPEFEQFCADFIRPGDICADIGANLGLKSLLMAQHAPTGRVIAVEAAPSVAALLRRNVADSGLGTITVTAAAVGERDGTTRFAEASAFGHIAETGTEIPMRTLAGIVADAGLDRLDIVKIDVEGYEFPILQSSLDLFERSRAVIYMEFNSWCQVALSKVAPLAFIEWILGNFAHVFVVGRQRGEPYLARLNRGGERDFLHRNMLDDQMVTDLVVTNHADRIPAQALQARLPKRFGLGTLNALLRRRGFELRRVAG